jgi:hypothetical protein
MQGRAARDGGGTGAEDEERGLGCLECFDLEQGGGGGVTRLRVTTNAAALGCTCNAAHATRLMAALCRNSPSLC